MYPIALGSVARYQNSSKTAARKFLNISISQLNIIFNYFLIPFSNSFESIDFESYFIATIARIVRLCECAYLVLSSTAARNTSSTAHNQITHFLFEFIYWIARLCFDVNKICFFFQPISFFIFIFYVHSAKIYF